MAFLEYNQIENMTGTSNAYAWLWSTIAVGVGFGLKTWNDYFLKNKSYKEAGRVFEFNLEALNINMKYQIEEIKEYIKETEKLEDFELMYDAMHSFDFINKVDFHHLIKYYQKTESDASTYVNSFYMNFEYAKTALQKLPNLISDYEGKLASLEDSFLEEINTFENSLKYYINKIFTDKSTPDTEFKEFYAIYNQEIEKCKYHASSFIELEENLYIKFKKHRYIKTTNHEMYKPINNFFQNSNRLVMKITELKDSHVYKIEGLKDVIIDSYEVIFGEDYADLPTKEDNDLVLS